MGWFSTLTSSSSSEQQQEQQQQQQQNQSGSDGAAAAASAAPSSAGAAAATAAAAADAPSPSPATPPPPEEDPWEVNKPVERRTQALNDEAHDCLYCFWSWITCGGPGARVRQLYVNGKLSRCMDDWTRLKNCMVFKMDPEKDMRLIPGPHPVWRIRSRKEAAAFWKDNYKHLAEGVPRDAVDGGQGGGGGGGERPGADKIVVTSPLWRDEQQQQQQFQGSAAAADDDRGRAREPAI